MDQVFRADAVAVVSNCNAKNLRRITIPLAYRRDPLIVGANLGADRKLARFGAGEEKAKMFELISIGADSINFRRLNESI
jgi:hypothetical protein